MTVHECKERLKEIYPEEKYSMREAMSLVIDAIETLDKIEKVCVDAVLASPVGATVKDAYYFYNICDIIREWRDIKSQYESC